MNSIEFLSFPNFRNHSIRSRPPPSMDPNANSWHSAFLAYHNHNGFVFSSAFNPNVEYLTPIQLKDIPGLANLWHAFKFLTLSTSSRYPEVKNNKGQVRLSIQGDLVYWTRRPSWEVSSSLCSISPWLGSWELKDWDRWTWKNILLYLLI